jgi:hypothetical protein
VATEVSGRGNYAPDRARERSQRRWIETKPSFLTTEFYAMVAMIVATIIAGESNNSWDDRWVWQVVGAIAIGYMVSRGLAKSGIANTRVERD